MDGELSSIHHPLQLLDLVDYEWQTDCLSEDDLHLPSSDLFNPPEELDETAAILTDADSASWSLSISKHSLNQLSLTASGLGVLAITPAHAATLNSAAAATGIGMNQAHSSTGTTSSTSVAGSSHPSSAMGPLLLGSSNSLLSSVESVDGLRWTDLGLASFRAMAAKDAIR